MYHIIIVDSVLAKKKKNNFCMVWIRLFISTLLQVIQEQDTVLLD